MNKIRDIKEIYFHESCPDGTASALICAAAYHLSHTQIPEFSSIQYGTKRMENLQPKANQLFVDITPPINRWEEWKDFSPVVLDHHETAKCVTEGLGGIYGGTNHSGALLAYENVFLPLCGENAGWRNFAELSMIRDTWKTSHERWKESQEVAQSLLFFGAKNLLGEINSNKCLQFEKIFSTGKILLENVEKKAALLARGAIWDFVQVNGNPIKHNIAIFNCTEKLISETAHILLDKGAKIAAGFFTTYEDGEIKWVVSLRTEGEFSANTIAAKYGGGGHNKAAGFQIHDAYQTSIKSVLILIRQALNE